MKLYKYSIKDFGFTVLIPILFMIGIFIWALVGTLDGGITPLYSLIFWGVPILFLSTLIGLHNPSVVIIKEDVIQFRALKITHTYKWDELSFLQLKKYNYLGKSYIRIGTRKLFGGRYWITNKMENYHELISILDESSSFYNENRLIRLQSLKEDLNE